MLIRRTTALSALTLMVICTSAMNALGKAVPQVCGLLLEGHNASEGAATVSASFSQSYDASRRVVGSRDGFGREYMQDLDASRTMVGASHITLPIDLISTGRDDFRHIYSALWDNEAPQIGLLADREREASIVRYALSLPGMTEQVRAFRKQQQEHYREAQAAGYSDIHGAMAHVNERQLIMRLRFQAQNLKPGFVIKIEFSPADYGL